MLEHYKVNVVGPLLLFQATAELLDAAPKPKYIVISSTAGSIASQEKLPLETTAYGSFKAAVNFVTRKIHFENPKIVVFPLQPGWLRTEVSCSENPHSDVADVQRWEIEEPLVLAWKKLLQLWRKGLLASSTRLTRLLERRLPGSSSLSMGRSSHGRRTDD